MTDTNQERARRALDVLVRYSIEVGEDGKVYDYTVADLICDIAHLADTGKVEGLSIDHAFLSALDHWAVEVSEEATA